MTTQSNRKSWRAALALGVLLGATVLTPVHAPAAEQKKDQKRPTVSDALRKQLEDAQKSLQAKDWPSVIAKTNAAAANPKKTPYDQHVIDEWQGFAYANTQDWPNAAKHLETTLTDGFIAPADEQSRTQLVTQSYFNAGVKARDTDKTAEAAYLDKAIQYGTKAIDGGAGPEYSTMVVNAAYLKGDYKTAAKYEQQLVDSQLQKGQTPSDEQLDMLRSAYYKLNDNANLFNAFKTSLTYHPTPELWEQVLSVVETAGALRNPATELQLFRLKLQTKTLKHSNEYSEFADTALRQGSPGEAKSILESGFAANVFSDAVKADNKKMLASATAKGQADQASLPAQEKEVRAAPTGQKLYSLGFAYFGYGQYDKAADLLKQALDKGGVQNEPDTRLLLGIAQLKGGHQDDALKTFQQVKGNESLEQIAQLWPIAVKSGT